MKYISFVSGTTRSIVNIKVAYGPLVFVQNVVKSVFFYKSEGLD